MSAPEETHANESYKVEIQIATILLGFIFVMYSIILTMPSNVLSLLTSFGIKNLFGFQFIASVNLISEAGLYCSFSLLGAILFYLLFIKLRKEWILLIARSLLAVGLYLSAILLVLINVLFSARLVSSVQAITSITLFASLVVTLSTISLFIYLPAIWLYWLYENRRFVQRALVKLKNSSLKSAQQ